MAGNCEAGSFVNSAVNQSNIGSYVGDMFNILYLCIEIVTISSSNLSMILLIQKTKNWVWMSHH